MNIYIRYQKSVDAGFTSVETKSKLDQIPERRYCIHLEVGREGILNKIYYFVVLPVTMFLKAENMLKHTSGQ